MWIAHGRCGSGLSQVCDGQCGDFCFKWHAARRGLSLGTSDKVLPSQVLTRHERYCHKLVTASVTQTSAVHLTATYGVLGLAVGIVLWPAISPTAQLGSAGSRLEDRSDTRCAWAGVFIH